MDIGELISELPMFSQWRDQRGGGEQETKSIVGNLDDYYKDLPSPSGETAADRAWRLYLARMDRRKMKPTTEKTEGGVLINWNPEIEPELKKYSEKALAERSELMKYISLKLWANFKFRGDEQYKQYTTYGVIPNRRSRKSRRF